MYDLTIAIPTYQRLPQLQNNLMQLLRLIRENGLTDRIQVCVSDNGSTDGTWAFLEQIRQDYAFVKCFRQSENLRFARNFWTVGLMGDGKYLYFSGDDDSIPATSLDTLLRQAERFSHKALIMNSSLPSTEYSRRNPETGEVLELSDSKNYLDQCGLFFATFIGNLLFRRDYFQQYRECQSRIEQSAYPHFIPALRAIRSGDALVVNEPVCVPDDSIRSWRKWQRVYTAVDMARLVKQEMAPFLPENLTGNILRSLARSLPMACVYFWQNEWERRQHPGKLSFWSQSEPPMQNPYVSCSLANLWDIYMKNSYNNANTAKND